MPIRQTEDGSFVISAYRVFKPGAYDTKQTARYAYQFPEETLDKLQDAANKRGGRQEITMADLKSARDEVSGPLGTFRQCAVGGCDGNAHYTAKGAHGYCRPHYRRWKTHGDPAQGYALWGEPRKFFEEIVVPCRSEECLIWPYGRRNGYGVMNVDGTSKRVHRRACIEVHGEPPTPSHEAAHSCGRGKQGCVNPMHLRWATGSENQLDRAIHGTSNRGERCGSAKLTREQVRQIREQIGQRRVKDIAADFGIIPATVGAIRRKEIWSWLD